MPGLLDHRAVTDELRRAHDRHRHVVVLAVLGLLVLYAYLFTDLHRWLGVPAPRTLAAAVGIHSPTSFDSDGSVEALLYISYTRRLDGDVELWVYLLALALAFLGAYYLPLRHKRRALVGAALAAVAVLYGPRGAAGLVACHLLVYLTLHPAAPDGRWAASVAGAAAWLALGDGPTRGSGWLVLGGAVLGAPLLHRQVWVRLLGRARLAAGLRLLVVQSPLITVCIGALVEGATGREGVLPLGVLLFFWQWARLMLYHIDYQDGRVPPAPTVVDYLSVFVSPAVIPVWQWGIAFGQGYWYLDDKYLCEDKNRIVLAGARLLLVALAYLVLAHFACEAIVAGVAATGIPVYGGDTRTMVRAYMDGVAIHAASVLGTTFLDLMRWILLWGGVFHFKVGVWRLCGYKVDPDFQFPLLSTNLVALWTRLTFHYREYLVRAFYYPVFFRYFKSRPALRTFAATLAAAGLGNLIWGHLTEHMYYDGMHFENFGEVLGAWPYYVLLAFGIGLSEIVQRKFRRRRRPWTLGLRLLLDVLAAYATLQAFALFRMFNRPAGGSGTVDLLRLFARAFGFEL